ncbi:regulatory protein Rop [Bacillus subtilis BEST7613]|nr:regulatory protein Rop [Bacillus subtilis BEST7613]
MTKQEKTALNMARFIRSQTLTLLEKLNELDADEQADICESLHDHADELYRRGSLGCRSKFELGTLAAADPDFNLDKGLGLTLGANGIGENRLSHGFDLQPQRWGQGGEKNPSHRQILTNTLPRGKKTWLQHQYSLDLLQISLP